jgi:hypothetical protein
LIFDFSGVLFEEAGRHEDHVLPARNHRQPPEKLQCFILRSGMETARRDAQPFEQRNKKDRIGKEGGYPAAKSLDFFEKLVFLDFVSSK